MNRSDDDAMRCEDEEACDCSSLGTNVELLSETFDVLKEAPSSFERTGENIPVIKPTGCTNFSDFIFGIKFYMFQMASSVHHQEFFIVQTAMVYVIQVLLTESCQQYLYDIYRCCVCCEKLLLMDRRTVRNMYSFIPKIN